MKTWHKTSAIVLAVVMLLLAIPFTAMADEPATNLALNKTVTASSVLEGYGPENVVDGDDQTFWCSVYGNGAAGNADDRAALTNWLQVDLGDNYLLESVVLDLRPLGTIFKGGPLKVTVEVKDNETDEWTKAVDAADATAGSWVTKTYTFDLPAETTGRYVKVTFNGTWDDGDLAHMLAELEVMGREIPVPLTNIALGKTVTASSVLEGYGSENVVDGDDQTFWCSVYGNGAAGNADDRAALTNWLQVDLGGIGALESVVLDLRPLGTIFKGGPLKVTVEVKDNETDEWTKAVDAADATAGSWVTKTYTFDLPAETTGRYVKVTFNGTWDDGDLAHMLSELEIMGVMLTTEPDPTDPDPTDPDPTDPDPTDPDPTDPDPTDPDPTDPEPTEPPQLENLALGKDVTASELSNDGAAFYPDKAVDGDDTTFWSSNWGAGDPLNADDRAALTNWLQVDLGDVCALESVVLDLRYQPEINAYRCGPLKVTVEVKANEADEWTKVVDGADATAGAWVTQTYSFDLPAETTGRYVKITFHGTWDDGILMHQLAELEVMGYDASPDTGDDMNAAVVVLPILALCGVAAVVVFRKKFSV